MPGRMNHSTERPKSLGRAAKIFVRSLRPWALPIVIAIILATVATVCTIFGPNLLGQMTNTAVENFQSAMMASGGEAPSPEALNAALDWGKIGGIALTMIVLYAVSAVLNYIQDVILALVAARYARTMRAKIIEKISRLPISYFDRHQIGDTLSRMSNDVSVIANTLSNVLAQIITSVTTLIGILIMMFTISGVLSLVALIAMPLSLILVSFVARKSQGYFRQGRAVFGALTSVIEEDYAGLNLIKANTYGETAINKFEKSNDHVCVLTWKANFLSALAFPITNMLTNFTYVAICVLGGRMAIDGKLLIGDVQAFLQYTSQFNRPITEVAQITTNIQQTLAASERVFDFLAETEETPDPEPARTIQDVKGAVEFRHVNFSYDQKQPVIHDVSIKVKPGMQVAIVGPTGAGKTTIINLLMRFYDPDSGQILIDGIPTREMKRADVRRMFGMVLQDTWLFSGTIEENLKYGRPRATHEDIVRATTASNTHHFIESLSHGYRTLISEDSDNISAGEKQLLTIARAMVADPPMIILDEATSNVDTRTEQLIQDAFARLTHGRTSFVIAHRLSTIRNSDLILVMKDGNIIEQGKHEELLAQHGFYADLYNSQFEKK